MGAVSLITLLVLLHAFFLSICVVVGKDGQICSPSSCGDIRNISYPFRLKSDPPSCGFPQYELICENNRTMVNLQEYYGGKYEKYLVTQINYHNYTIRVVDHPGIVKKQNCWISSPLHSIPAFDTPSPYEFPYSYTIILMKCEESVSQNHYIPIVSCNTTGYPSSSSPTYVYAVFVDYNLTVGDIPNSCTVGTYMVIQPSKPLPNYPSYLSMSDLQDYMFQALQLSFLFFCHRHCEMKGQSCNPQKWNAFQCNPEILDTAEMKKCEYNKMPTHT